MLIALDTETPVFTRTKRVQPVICVSLASKRPLKKWLPREGVLSVKRRGFYAYLLDAQAAREAYGWLIEQELIIHNAVYDLAVLAQDTGLITETFLAIDENRVYCTRLREKLIALALGELRFRRNAKTNKNGPTEVSLAQCVARYLAVDIYEDKKSAASWRMRFEELAPVPIKRWPGEAKEYATMDAVWHYEVALAQEQTAPGTVDGHVLRNATPGALPRFRGELEEVKADWALYLGSVWGLTCDPRQVQRTVGAWRKEADKGIKLGQRAGFIRADGSRDMEKLRARIARAFGVEGKSNDEIRAEYPFLVSAPSSRYPSGQIRDASEVLAVITEEQDRVLWQYAQSKQAISFVSKYAETLERGTRELVTYRADSLKTTGRTSISDPPMQQPLRHGGFRECFIPRRGFLYAQCDYSQIELRAWAQVLEDWGLGSTLADAFRKGVDPHVLMAADILNAEGEHKPPKGATWSYKQAMRALAGRYGEEARALVKSMRQLAKAANFGYPGGLGAPSFVDYCKNTWGVVISEPRARELKALWLARWPEAAEYFAVINSKMVYTSTFTAVQPVTGRLRGDCRFTDGCNTHFQGYVADGFKATAWELACECYLDVGSPLFGSRMVLPLHDEFILEVPENKAHEAAFRLGEVMRETMQSFIPDIPIEAAPALMRRWYKEADPVFDENDRLVPWEPGEQ